MEKIAAQRKLQVELENTKEEIRNLQEDLKAKQAELSSKVNLIRRRREIVQDYNKKLQDARIPTTSIGWYYECLKDYLEKKFSQEEGLPASYI